MILLPDPTYFLTHELLAAFKAGDLRRSHWVDSLIFPENTYYFPVKYKVNTGTQGRISEYYSVFRLAEQYLIRAEARTRQNKLTDAISDINVIRRRANLADLPNTLLQEEIIDTILHERQIEFFCEWGHRWLDLKRTGLADEILSPIKPQWQSYQKLYPIPTTEMQANPALLQNPGF